MDENDYVKIITDFSFLLELIPTRVEDWNYGEERGEGEVWIEIGRGWKRERGLRKVGVSELYLCVHGVYLAEADGGGLGPHRHD